MYKFLDHTYKYNVPVPIQTGVLRLTSLAGGQVLRCKAFQTMVWVDLHFTIRTPRLRGVQKRPQPERADENRAHLRPKKKKHGTLCGKNQQGQKATALLHRLRMVCTHEQTIRKRHQNLPKKLYTTRQHKNRILRDHMGHTTHSTHQRHATLHSKDSHTTKNDQNRPHTYTQTPGRHQRHGKNIPRQQKVHAASRTRCRRHIQVAQHGKKRERNEPCRLHIRAGRTTAEGGHC